MSDRILARVIASGTNLFIVDTEKQGSFVVSAKRNVFDNLIKDEQNQKKAAYYEMGAKPSKYKRQTSVESVQKNVILPGDICELEPIAQVGKDSNVDNVNANNKNSENQVLPSFTISNILSRSNTLIRPRVANIDQIVIVIAPAPAPDLLLIDKLVINAIRQHIAVVLCINKSDLDAALRVQIEQQYKNVAKIISTAAKLGDIKELKAVLSGKLTAFAGQSAVGKSSLVNALKKSAVQKTDELSIKIARGKNTTVRAEIIKLSNKTYIIDTPGFSVLDIHGVLKEDIGRYYPEYVELADSCKYSTCSHTVEPHCAVIAALKKGSINKDRHDRYCVLRVGKG